MGETSLEPRRSSRRQRKARHTYVWMMVALLFFATSLLAAYHFEVFPFAREAAGTDIPANGIGQGQVEEGELDEGQGGEGQGAADPEEQPGLASMEQALSARGLYVTMDVFGTPSRFADVITFIRSNPGLNCLVIDVKDNNGRIPREAPGIPSKAASYNHFSALVNVLKQEGYYLIARIVAFQDPHMAMAAPGQAIRNADGTLWRDRDGRLWLNPYDKRNWEFVKDVSMWAVDMGFDEIQLDYVRFPDSAQGLEKKGVLMPGHEEYESRGDAIAAFLEYMGDALENKAYLSADVFGFVTIAQDDMGIGQRLEQLADLIDFICPMVYPSHYYNPGIYGFEVPEKHPYEVVYKAMEEALDRTQGLRGKVRPWLQDFSMRYRYGPQEVQGQVNAVFEHGIYTYMLWNPANVYTEGVDYAPGI
ncbi:MAG TPA: hypothetical protein GXZ88_06945 [Firmicutes bacterium]|jgi:hypothetical protein|nr:hypothetical protein [Candidatus Fermentithermobacillaceae bacterium]